MEITFLFLEVIRKNVDIFKDSPPSIKTGKIQIGPIAQTSRFIGKKDKDEKPNWEHINKRLPEKPKSPPPLPPEPIKTIVDKFSFRVKVSLSSI